MIILGRVCKINNNIFVVIRDNNFYNCISPKKVKNLGKIFVGDNIEFCLDVKTNEYIITKVLERKNKLIRPFVTNITQLFIVLASLPEPDFLLIDKLIINAKMNDIEPILVLNKCDLTSNLLEVVHNEYDNANIKILEVSTKTGQNIDSFKKMLKDNISALAGQSATGKTSIINLITNQNRKTNNLSEKVMRGKNTTTNAELIVLDNNSFVLDTAGFSKIEFEQLNPILIKDYYDEFKNFNCSFKDCKHIFEGEKFCEVLKNLGDKINKNRYERYKQIYLECEKNWSNRYD